MFPTAKQMKSWTGTTESSPFNRKSISINIYCIKGLTTKQTECEYSKCTNKEVVGS